MSSSIQQQLENLEILCKAKPELRTVILQHSDPELFEAISEICYNYTRGNINCSKQQFKHLNKHKNCIRKLAKDFSGKKIRKGSRKYTKKYTQHINSKKQILAQKGDGFFLPLLLPIVGELAAHFIKKFVTK